MKKVLSLLAVVFAVGLSTAAMDAEAAKRMGSGKSIGMQRQATQDKAPSAPTQSNAAAPAAGAAGAAAAPSRSWMGPIAGLAAGLGIAALASHLGFGGELASMVMMGLLVFAVILAIGFFVRKRAGAQTPIGAAPNGMQYARIDPHTEERTIPAYKVAMPNSGDGAVVSPTGGQQTRERFVPADFDAPGFERNAKVNFIRLQASNDAGNLDDIREFTTPEMYAELKMEIAERGASTQKSEVVSINAEVIDVEQESDRHVLSVRFTGVIRYQGETADEPFDEIWHLTKPRQGSGGWVVSGIQQTA
ncbi:MAG: Tim44 domain-containing protein [Rhodocyclaceae bacterium]|nr:Tim44 domain-containing protein [Rhodocyclaceae bacterium]